MNRKKTLIFMIPIYAIVLAGMIGFAQVGSKTVTVMSESAAVTDRKVVVIDAGHGGVDGGATSVSGVLESKTNLEIALKLRDVFHLLGIKTIMIRTEDISVYTSGETIAAKKVSDLKERVRIVNEFENCLLISIHQNYFTDSRYSGAQVFYGPQGEGQSFAPVMQKALVDSLNPGSNRKAKKADGVYLMQHVDCTGLLIECGFISNQQEDLMLQSKDYQQKICAVIATVTSRYLNT